MKKLLIVESPAKIKTITKFLDRDFRVMSTIGHIKDLPPRKIGVEIAKSGEITLEYDVLKDKQKVITEIVREAQKCGEIYLAPDPDREGEIIAWHIGQDIAKVVPKGTKIFRITFNEITKEAILEAIANPGEIDERKVAAQQARRVLDRWVGYQVSPILWRKISKGLSAGRVQSVALRLICDRETEILNFKAVEYWTIDAIFKAAKAEFSAQLTKINNKKAEPKTQAESEAITSKLQQAQYVVSSIEDKQRLKNPLPPFMTSTLQQAAYNRLGFSVKKTMQIAQNLYEGVTLDDPNSPIALITYMRSDSLRIADSAVKSAREYISSNYGKDYLPASAKVYAKAGKAQDAHEAIRPIKTELHPDIVQKYVSTDQAKLYKLIWQRFIATQMNQAIYAQRQVTINGVANSAAKPSDSSKSDNFEFKVTGSTLIFDGFLKVYNLDEEDAEQIVKIPKDLADKQALDLNKIDPKQHFTQASPRYSEATLVKELEKEGIGRPSTYATILNTIRERSYTTLNDKKRFMPTELGLAVTKLLVENLPHIMDPKFTAHMEEDLDKIAEGTLARDSLLNDFYTNFKADLERFQESGARAPQVTDIACPQCHDRKLVIKFSKNGEFLGCAGYPDCSFTCNFEKTETGELKLLEKQVNKAELLEETCPKCNANKLRKMVGRFGPFISCSGYPACKYIQVEKLGISCPICKTGDIIKRQWRGGSFWGCNNYPKCQFAIFGELVEQACPLCQLPILSKKTDRAGQDVYSCGAKTCTYSSDGSKATYLARSSSKTKNSKSTSKSGAKTKASSKSSTSEKASPKTTKASTSKITNNSKSQEPTTSKSKKTTSAKVPKTDRVKKAKSQ
jgi:DNA topoisomerase-1